MSDQHPVNPDSKTPGSKTPGSKIKDPKDPVSQLRTAEAHDLDPSTPLVPANSKAQTTSEEPSSNKYALIKSSSVVSVATLGSRLLGLVRDLLIAQYFGIRADAFFVAFKIPNLFRRFFAEGAFANAFVPVLTEYQVQRSTTEVYRLVQYALGSLCALLLPLTCFGVLGAPLLIALFAPGFYQFDDKFTLTVDLLRITFPYLWLISLTAFAGAVLNTYQRFAIPAIAPMVLNGCMILFTLLLAPQLDEPLFALAWAVFTAGIIQWLIHLPQMHHLGLLPKPKVNFKDPGVRKILSLMAPILFGASVYQLNILVDLMIASFLPEGSITWLYFSDRLVQLPLGVIAIALSVVILPKLSSAHHQQNPEQFSQTLDFAVRILWLLGLPATLGLMLLAEPILSLLFLHGAMRAEDIAEMVPSLQAYAMGLFAFMMIKVLAPAFFARQQTKTPVRIGIQAMGISIVLNFPLAYGFQHVGLALSTSIGAFANMGLLYWTLKRKGYYQNTTAWSVFLKILIANLAMVVMLIALQQVWKFDASAAIIIQLSSLLTVILAALGFYAITLRLLGFSHRDFTRLDSHAG